MSDFLKRILPGILPSEYVVDENCFIRPHRGKSHLQKNIPQKVQAFRHYGPDCKVLIVHDQDGNDCVALKRKLQGLAGDALPVLVRIVCRELENWYLGDFVAIDKVYPKARVLRKRNKAIYRVPDGTRGAVEMEKLVPGFTKREAAESMPIHMEVEANQSASFRNFVSGLRRFLEESREG